MSPADDAGGATVLVLRASDVVLFVLAAYCLLVLLPKRLQRLWLRLQARRSADAARKTA